MLLEGAISDRRFLATETSAVAIPRSSGARAPQLQDVPGSHAHLLHVLLLGLKHAAGFGLSRWAHMPAHMLLVYNLAYRFVHTNDTCRPTDTQFRPSIVSAELHVCACFDL